MPVGHNNVVMRDDGLRAMAGNTGYRHASHFWFEYWIGRVIIGIFEFDPWAPQPVTRLTASVAFLLSFVIGLESYMHYNAVYRWELSASM